MSTSPDAELNSGMTRRGFVAATTLFAAGSTALHAQEKADMQPSASWKLATAAVQNVQRNIIRISREVWDKPAVGLKEFEAMQVHIKELESNGFKLTKEKAGGHPTAFVAEWSQGKNGPILGFLPEYDALPGLANTAEPKPTPRQDGKTDGHACGHNCLGAGCTGAALALKLLMQKSNLAGTIRVYGCGAEENEGAKVYMAKAGLFDDLDAALAWHPTPFPITGTLTTTATRKIYITWRGKTAHAGNEPWSGRSALDAAELFTHGVNLMREHVHPTARMHYIYQIAGVAPNIVPDEARIWMTARDISSERVQAMTTWLAQLAEGAAMGTQTKVSFVVPIGDCELLPNEVLANRLNQHMLSTPLNWTEEEQTFAKTCQKAMGVPETGLATQVYPMIKDKTVGGATDVGDVSWKTPIALFGWPTLPQGISLHSWPVTACGGMSIGDKGSIAAATILTALGYDLLVEPELRAAAKAEHQKRLNGRKYVATLANDHDRPEEAANRFLKNANEEALTNVDR